MWMFDEVEVGVERRTCRSCRLGGGAPQPFKSRDEAAFSLAVSLQQFTWFIFMNVVGQLGQHYWLENLASIRKQDLGSNHVGYPSQ